MKFLVKVLVMLLMAAGALALISGIGWGAWTIARWLLGGIG